MLMRTDATPLYPGMASADVVSQLDVLFSALTLLTLVHAARHRGLLAGLAVVCYLALHTAAFEHIALFLGGTHCHASSALLPMMTPCSSINSVLFYVPWTYSSIEAARRLSLPRVAYPLAVGLLQFGFGTVYEMQGPHNKFWQWPDAAGVIASSPVLAPWNGYPPLAGLAHAKAQHEVATIVSGVFRVSQHAGSALTERIYMFPVLAPYFHFAFGFAWALGLVLTGETGFEAGPPSLARLVAAGVLSVALFLPPIWVTRGVSEAAGLPLVVSVPASLALSCLALLLLSRERRQRAVVSTPGTTGATDPLLFSISLGMHAFMVSFPWRADEPSPAGLIVLVTAVATMHVIAQGFCCFLVSTEGKGQNVGQKFE